MSLVVEHVWHTVSDHTNGWVTYRSYTPRQRAYRNDAHAPPGQGTSTTLSEVRASATHKIWLAANHKPTIRGTDHGIWRRVKLIPFTVTIPDSQQDKSLPDKLLAELPGIFNWAIQGCIEWQRDGLGEPQAVKAATADYRHEMDVLGDFIAECCVVADRCYVNTTTLYEAYTRWAESHGERQITSQRFGNQLTERGFAKDREVSGRIIRRGIGLRELSEHSEHPEPISYIPYTRTHAHARTEVNLEKPSECSECSDNVRPSWNSTAA